MVLFTLDSKVSEFLEYSKQFTPCQEAFDWALGEWPPDSTLRDVLPTIWDKTENWFLWGIKVLGHLFDADLLDIWLDRLITPQLALQVYMDCPFLTDEHDNKLRAVYQGKLPTSEKKIADGDVIRAKQEL